MQLKILLIKSAFNYSGITYINICRHCFLIDDKFHGFQQKIEVGFVQKFLLDPPQTPLRAACKYIPLAGV